MTQRPLIGSRLQFSIFHGRLEGVGEEVLVAIFQGFHELAVPGDLVTVYLHKLSTETGLFFHARELTLGCRAVDLVHSIGMPGFVADVDAVLIGSFVALPLRVVLKLCQPCARQKTYCTHHQQYLLHSCLP